MSDTVLDLTQLVTPTDEQGDPILIDEEGTPHYFRARDAMTLRERAQLQSWITRQEELAKKEKPTEAMEIEHQRVLIDICSFVLPTVDRAVFDSLNDGQRLALVVAFLVDSGMESALGKVTMSRAQRIGAMASPASNGSTA